MEKVYGGFFIERFNLYSERKVTGVIFYNKKHKKTTIEANIWWFGCCWG